MSTFRKRLLIILSLVSIFALPALAQARILSCRSDPHIVLSNGAVIDLSANISTLRRDVREVHYELHVPVGVTANLVVHTPSWGDSEETFTLVADQSPNTYRTVTLARTRPGNATVTANLRVMTPRVAFSRVSISGLENVPLVLTVSH